MVVFICFITAITVPLLFIFLTCNRISKATKEIKGFGEKIKNKQI